MWMLANIPPPTLMRFAVPLYTFGVALLIAVAMFGLTRKGAKRWLNVGVVIQPSEIMKIAMPLMLAWYYQRREGADSLVGLHRRLRDPDGAGRPDREAARPRHRGAGVRGGLLRHLLRGTEFQAARAGAGGGCRRGRVRRGVPGPHLPARSELAADARLSEAPHLHAARSDLRSARQGLPHDSGGHRDRLRRHARQGLAEGHAGAPRIHPRKAYRLHLRGVLRGIRARGRRSCCSFSTWR